MSEIISEIAHRLILGFAADALKYQAQGKEGLAASYARRVVDMAEKMGVELADDVMALAAAGSDDEA